MEGCPQEIAASMSTVIVESDSVHADDVMRERDFETASPVVML
jgi:predicted Zn-dependent protease with MMP-like domain